MDRPNKSTTLSPIALDTDILVECARGSAAALSFIHQFPFPTRFISAITLMELLQGCSTDEELNATTRWTNNNIYDIWHVDFSISKKAEHLIQTHAARHGLRVADALIAATSLEKGAQLATGNVKHFQRIHGLEILPFRHGS